MSALLAGLVLGLLALSLWGYVLSAVRHARQTSVVPASGVDRRLFWSRAAARRRAWTTGRDDGRPGRLSRSGSFAPGRPSPAIRRFRARVAIRHLTRDWQVVRYPY